MKENWEKLIKLNIIKNYKVKELIIIKIKVPLGFVEAQTLARSTTSGFRLKKKLWFY